MTEKIEVQHARGFAVSELIRFADDCGVEITPEEVEKDADGPLGRLATHIQRKRITIEDTDEGLVAVYPLRKPQGPHKVSRFAEPDGSMLRALDQRGTDEANHKALQCFAAAIVKVPPATVAGMRNTDLKVHTDMAKLFLG